MASPGVLGEAGKAELRTERGTLPRSGGGPEGARYMDVPSNLLGDTKYKEVRF
jgi:hypothetical protein